MNKFLILPRGLFRITAPSLYELILCRRMREELAPVFTAQGEPPGRAKELAGAACFCFFSLKPLIARRFRSPEQICHSLTLVQLEKISKLFPSGYEEDRTETGFNPSFAEEVSQHGHS